MDNELREILTSLTNSVNSLAEGQKEMAKDIADIKEDIAEIKYEAKITRTVLNRHGEILEQMVKDLEPLNLLNVKYE